jgi:hypothetical protein
MPSLHRLYKEALAKSASDNGWHEQAENRTWHPDYPGLGSLSKGIYGDPDDDPTHMMTVSPEGFGGPGYSKWDQREGVPPPKWNGSIFNFDTGEPLHQTQGDDPYEVAQQLDQHWSSRGGPQ